MVIALLGMPGVGKTTLTMRLACRLSAQGHPCLVVHTDVLKVTLRALGVTGLRGPGYAPGVHARLDIVRPILEAHAKKARKDGYTLLVEGTLAMGLCAEHIFILQAPQAVRRARIAHKHNSARDTLASANLTEYQSVLEATPGLRVDATPPEEVVVDTLMGHLLS